jgi:hypothetical protein
VRVDEWAQELADTLAHGWGGSATMTVAASANAAALEEVIATARKTVEAAGWDLFEVDACRTVGDPSVLQDTGYVILRDISDASSNRSIGADKRFPASPPEKHSGRHAGCGVPGRDPCTSPPSRHRVS